MLELCLHDMNLNFDQTLNTCICIPKLIIQDIIIKKIEIVDIKSCLSPIWFNNFLASCKMSRYYVGKYTSPTAAVPLHEHLSEVIQLFKKEVEIPPPHAVMSKLRMFASISKFNWEGKFKKMSWNHIY